MCSAAYLPWELAFYPLGFLISSEQGTIIKKICLNVRWEKVFAGDSTSILRTSDNLTGQELQGQSSLLGPCSVGWEVNFTLLLKRLGVGQGLPGFQNDFEGEWDFLLERCNPCESPET